MTVQKASSSKDTGVVGELQRQRLAALYEVGARLGTNLDLDELLAVVMDAIIQLTGAERGFVVLKDQVTGKFQVVAARNLDQKRISDRSMEISRSILRRAIEEARPILSDDAQEDRRFAEEQSVVGFRLRSTMCAPLQARGRVIGAIYVDNRVQSRAFDRDDLDLLVALAGQVAISIDNARLFQQTDEALARRVQELTLFQGIDRELNHSLEMDKVLTYVLNWAIRLTEADGGAIGLIHFDRSLGRPQLQLLVSQPATEQQQPGSAVLTASHPVLAQVLTARKTVRTVDVKPEEALESSPAPVQLAVPVRREGRVIGLISLHSRNANAFPAEDQAFVERLADRAAVAIEKSRLYGELQAANAAKNDFISVVTHELRVPMTSIQGYTDMLLGEMVGTLNDTQRSFLQTIRRNLDRMNVLIRDLSDLNRIETGRMRLDYAAVNLREVALQTTDAMEEQFTAKEQKLTLDVPEDLPLVYADAARIQQVISNLLNNAHKYTPADGSITLQAQAQDEYVIVSVQDDGIGISEADQKKLFTQFFRSEVEAVREQLGWGLGLAIVKKLVEAQGGQVSCTSRLDGGSTFTFTLPVAPVGSAY